MKQEVSTSLGTIEVTEEDGHVRLRIIVREGVNLRSRPLEGGVDMFDAGRVPKPGDEVTVEGRTIEVVSVDDDGDSVWLHGDNGQKVRWL